MNVFDLAAKLTLDTSEYSSALKNAEQQTSEIAQSAEQKASGLGSKVGKFLKVGAAAGVAAVTAAATAVGALVKQSAQSYAEYEQLVGGVEKIFDEADISGIIQDANNAYKDLNMSANEYLASINQTGAAFAQTMGDEKGYEVARTGMLAIADYASGTGRNLSELNDKFALITRSTSSYQSIADQFSGILPATSAAFLEQAQAAGFLTDSYTSLTEVPIEEYQEAVTKMLEKGVAEMGLAGNTAKEAASTISGSIATTKAAWQNLITALSDPNADLGQMFDNLVESASSVVDNLLPVVEQALMSVGQLIAEGVPKLFERLPEILTTVVPSLITSAISLVSALVAALPEIMAGLIEAIPTILASIMEAFGPLVESLGALFTQAWEAVKAVFAPVGEWFTARKEDIQNAFAAVDTWFSEKFEAAKNFVHSAWESIGGWFGERWADIQGAMQSADSWFSEKFTSAKDAVHTAWSAIGTFFSDKWTEIKNVFSNAWEIFRGIGGNIVKGLIAGIGEWISSAINKARELIQRVKGAANAEAGIASPSKVFRRMGRFIDEGLMLGIDDEEDKPVNAITRIMKGLKAAGEGLRFTSSMNYASRGSSSLGGEDSGKPIIIQVVLDGKVIGETSYNYIRRRTRMVGA